MSANEPEAPESAASGVASSIRSLSSSPPLESASADLPATDSVASVESAALAQLASASAVESLAPVALSANPPGSKPPAADAEPFAQASDAREVGTPPPPSESLEFDDFFSDAERSSLASSDTHHPSDELEARPVVSAAQLARRADLRRLVTRIVGSLALASVLIFGKRLVFPPASIEELAAELPPPSLTLAHASEANGPQPTLPSTPAELPIDPAVPPPPVESSESESGEQEAAAQVSEVENQEPAPAKRVAANEAPAVPASKRPASSKQGPLNKNVALQAKGSVVKPTAPAALAAKPAAPTRSALPERRAARVTGARPRAEAPAAAPSVRSTLPASAAFPIAP